MRERRRNHRLSYNAVIDIDQVYNQDQVLKEARSFPIEIVDISKGGVGFIAKDDLPLHYYFNAKLDLGNGKQFYSVLKIIRKRVEDGNFVYGCEFTGLADVLSLYIDEFEQEVQENND